jgi:hypothetical protein
MALSACSADEPDKAGASRGAQGTGDSVADPLQTGQTSSGSAGSASASQPSITRGSSPVASGQSCSAISAQAENRRAPADIVIAVDNSGSMDEEIAFVRAELNAFSEQITASGVDVRIILISAAYTPPSAARPRGDDDDDESDESEEDNGICIDAPLGSGSCPMDTNAPRYLHIAREVKSHNALNLIVSTFPQWRDQLRPEATKTFVVVTDDDAEDGPNNSAAAFRQSVSGLSPELFASWSFSGIFCQRDCPEAAAIGTVYQQLVDETQGVAGDLCEQNFAPVFDALANAVIDAAGLACAWDIPPAPAGQAFDRAKVNVQYALGGAAPMSVLQVPNAGSCTDRVGWYYDDSLNPTKILVCPAACAMLQNDVQARFEVLFGCETQLAPQ